jgi:arylsulfatase A-like enzyme
VPASRPFGELCLAARRLVERGVRFVQVYRGGGGGGGWDAHAKLKQNHANTRAAVDAPIAGLLVDLEKRGLLEETMVVWATEFGRTPGAENAGGRDRHPYGFSTWLAGGGIKGGVVHGATDEIGFHAVEHRHYVTDIHATVLHQLGLDPHRMEVPGHKRLEMDFGKPIREIIA